MKKINAASKSNLVKAFGSRIVKASDLKNEAKKEASQKGIRRGFSWKPEDGAEITFDDEWFYLDGKTIALFAEVEGETKLITIPTLCRMCDDTQSVIAQMKADGKLSDHPMIETFMTFGMSDSWRAEQLFNKTFRVSVFKVNKTDKYWDDKEQTIKVRKDSEGNDVTYEATMIWLDEEIVDTTDTPAPRGRGRRRNTNA